MDSGVFQARQAAITPVANARLVTMLKTVSRFTWFRTTRTGASSFAGSSRRGSGTRYASVATMAGFEKRRASRWFPPSAMKIA